MKKEKRNSIPMLNKYEILVFFLLTLFKFLDKKFPFPVFPKEQIHPIN